MLFRNRLKLNTGTVFASVAMAIVFSTAAYGVANQIGDRAITDAVETQILLDQAVRLNDIDVTTTDGVVTLSGNVDNLLAEERAVRIAETVRGVRSVVDRLVVAPAVFRSDQAILEDVRDALFENPATESFDFDPAVEDGKVILKGTVSSWVEADIAQRIVRGIRGVTGVDNRITWEYESERPDFEIASEVEERLKWDVLINDGFISVRADDGVVELRGTVGSAAERSRAITKAWVTGVEDVDASDLRVDPDFRDKDVRSTPRPTVSDEEIRDAVKDALLYDPRVLSFKIGVDVDHGVVTLRGKVDNLRASRAASEDARNTVGVITVRNRVRIRTEAPVDDAIIESRVRDALRRDPYLEPYEVTVNARNGVVDLYGTVDSYFEKGQADDVASDVIGVIAVDNNLVVDHDFIPYAYDPYVDDWYLHDYRWYDYSGDNQPYRSDYQILRDIEDQLWWSPFVDADEVTVTVDNGVATLTGTVDSWAERRAARKNAYDGGALWVENELEIDYDTGS